MKTCFETRLAHQYPIKLEQAADGSFRVTYGLQVKAGLGYAEAAKELGECIMHSAACAGSLDNDVR